MSAIDAAAKLDDRVARGGELVARDIQTSEALETLDQDFDKWQNYGSDLLTTMFTTDKFAKEFRHAFPVMSLSMSWEDPGPGDRIQSIRNHAIKKIACLESIKERLELIPLASGVQQAPIAQLPVAKSRAHTNRAFIVHGHDDAAKETVARFVNLLGVDPIILHEQATEGRTLIEKLEHYSDVDFAIVLVTPDDVGANKAQRDNLQPRARQNVILELGYFAGRLGREKVCALVQTPLEMPTDVVGVVYIPWDPHGGWKLALARELRAAQFTVDMDALVKG